MNLTACGQICLMVTLSGMFGLKGGRFDRVCRFEHFNQF
jgi:hypothetical protein